MFNVNLVSYFIIIILVSSAITVVFASHSVFSLLFLVLSFLVSGVLLFMLECEFLFLILSLSLPQTFCFYFVMQFFSLRLAIIFFSQQCSTILEFISIFFLRMQILISFYPDRINLLIRFIFSILLIVFNSPELAYCMDLDITEVSISRGPYKYGCSQKISTLPSHLQWFKVQVDLLKIPGDEESICTSIRRIFRHIKRLLVHVHSVRDNVNVWDDIAQIKDTPEDLISWNSRQRKIAKLNNVGLIDENRGLRERVGAVNWNFSSALAAASGVVIAGVFIFVISPKNN